jgi:hypothetical protein
MDDKILTLNLSVKEINLILQCLGKQPYETVSELINRVLVDAQAQLQTIQSDSGATPDEE